MKWSLKLGSFAGIRVYLHWTFVILLGWILFSHLGQGHDWAEAWRGVGFIIALFGCLLLHEFGHALTAKHYGIVERIHSQCVRFGERNGFVSYVDGDNVAGFRKVAEAMLEQGVV